MRVLFILCLWMPMCLLAQTDSEKSACQSYEKMLAKAQAEEAKGQFPLALELYNIARIMAKNCPSAKNDFIKKKLAEISGRINNQEKDKLAAEVAASSAKQDREKAKREAEKAKADAEKERKAKELADKLRQEAEEAKRAAEEANKIAQAAREEAIRQKDLATAEKLKNRALLFAATSKKSVDITKKRNYFRGAYAYIRDSVRNRPELYDDPAMSEAAYESVFEDMSEYKLGSSDVLFKNSHINGLVLANNGRLYAAGGNGLIAEASLGKSDSVHTPSAEWKRYNTSDIPCISKDVRFCSQKINDIAVSPDGSLLAAAGESEQIWVFKDGEFMPDLSPKNLHSKAYINTIVFIDNERIASIGSDEKLVISNINSKDKPSTFDLQGLPIHLKYVPDYMGGTLVVSTTAGVQFIQPNSNKMTYAIKGDENKTPYYALILAKERKLLVAHHTKLNIYKIDKNDKIRTDSVISHDIAADLVDMIYAGDEFIALGFESGEAQLWKIADLDNLLAPPVCLQQPAVPLVRLAYYAPGKQVISSSKSGIFFMATDVHCIYNYLKRNNLGSDNAANMGGGY